MPSPDQSGSKLHALQNAGARFGGAVRIGAAICAARREPPLERAKALASQRRGGLAGGRGMCWETSRARPRSLHKRPIEPRWFAVTGSPSIQS